MAPLTKEQQDEADREDSQVFWQSTYNDTLQTLIAATQYRGSTTHVEELCALAREFANKAVDHRMQFLQLKRWEMQRG